MPISPRAENAALPLSGLAPSDFHTSLLQLSNNRTSKQNASPPLHPSFQRPLKPPPTHNPPADYYYYYGRSIPPVPPSNRRLHLPNPDPPSRHRLVTLPEHHSPLRPPQIAQTPAARTPPSLLSPTDTGIPAAAGWQRRASFPDAPPPAANVGGREPKIQLPRRNLHTRTPPGRNHRRSR